MIDQIPVQPIGVSYRAVIDLDSTRYDCIFNKHPFGGVIVTVISGADYFCVRSAGQMIVGTNGEHFPTTTNGHMKQLHVELLRVIGHIRSVYDGRWY
jgi:hypothetical protein